MRINVLKSLSLRSVVGMVAFFIIICHCFIYLRSEKVIKSDGDGYYLYLRSFMIDGDLHFKNEYDLFNIHRPKPDLSNVETKTGHIPNKYWIGPSILWMPYFVLAHLITFILNICGYSVEMDGYSIMYQIIVSSGSAFYGVLGLVLIYKLLKRYFSQKVAILSTLTVALGSNVIYYMLTEPAMSHSCSLFVVTSFIYVWLTKKEHPYYWAFLGGLLGMMTLVRPQNLMFSLLLLPEIIHITKKMEWKSFKHVLVSGLTFFIVLLPQLITWKVINGDYIHYSYGQEGFNFLHAAMWNSLFSPKHGLMQWTPIVGVSVLGLCFSLKNYRKLGILLLTAFITQWYINASWHSWWFGMSYGNRAYINCTFIFAFGLAYLLSSIKNGRKIFIAVIALLVIHNIFFFMEYSAGLYGSDQPVSFQQAVTGHFDIFGNMFSRLLNFFHLK